MEGVARTFRIALATLFVAVGCVSEPSATDPVADERDGMQVILTGRPVGDAFCVFEICWPLLDVTSVDPGELDVRSDREVIGLLTADGLILEHVDWPRSGGPFAAGLPTESNQLRVDVERFLSELDRWGQVDGLPNDRARVWFETVDQPLLLAIDGEFGDRVDVGGATMIVDASIDDYLTLHERIGASPPPDEIRARCQNGVVDVDPVMVGALDSTLSDCRPVAYRHNDAEIALAASPSPDDDSIVLIGRELACASARTPRTEDIAIVSDETSSRIAIAVMLTIPGGEAECPGNPTFTVRVQLEAPVGERSIVPYLGGPPLLVGEPAD